MLTLPPKPTLQDYQALIKNLEQERGWAEHSLMRKCFGLGEEMGELFKAIRKSEKIGIEVGKEHVNESVGEELADCLIYLLAIANRLDIDFEEAFRAKHAKNLERVWA